MQTPKADEAGGPSPPAHPWRVGGRCTTTKAGPGARRAAQGLRPERGHACADAPGEGPLSRAKGAAQTQPWSEAGRALYFGQACSAGIRPVGSPDAKGGRTRTHHEKTDPGGTPPGLLRSPPGARPHASGAASANPAHREKRPAAAGPSGGLPHLLQASPLEEASDGRPAEDDESEDPHGDAPRHVQATDGRDDEAGRPVAPLMNAAPHPNLRRPQPSDDAADQQADAGQEPSR